ncbi:Permease of the drug/metabolite transporter (DMT) superfamily [hydrothermal vent metagenome]|uniref:Permease of the drug/metabolite transporter (DMT) superfamily n=1 Tax=hydrothermal vent metagenome TaxID=652676 RepID=A0A3B0XB57_9ZZZZ
MNHKILIPIAFIVVTLIWSTTPLTIKWSGEGGHFLLAVLLRMGIGTVLAVVIALLVYKQIVFTYRACKIYVAVAMALFGGMVPVYWAAQYISTGLISVIFGIAPIITGFLAWRFIYEQRFSTMKMLGALSGLAGLISIFATGMAMGENYAYGVVAVLGAVVLHSISAVWIKSMKVDIAPISTVAGGLLFSMPMFIAVYLIFAPPLAGAIPMRALWSIVYLGVVGSVLGFVCYYYLLKRLPVNTVALITLITPVLALWIGRVFENEKMGFNIYMGTVLVLMGLTLHQWGDFLFKKLWKKRKLYST